uniref:Uncharacterized protein n=1 Tax=Steinernema glaseri TaxID=37863 RepID=A0A1I7ZYB0_9BILA
MHYVERRISPFDSVEGLADVTQPPRTPPGNRENKKAIKGEGEAAAITNGNRPPGRRIFDYSASINRKCRKKRSEVCMSGARRQLRSRRRRTQTKHVLLRTRRAVRGGPTAEMDASRTDRLDRLGQFVMGPISDWKPGKDCARLLPGAVFEVRTTGRAHNEDEGDAFANAKTETLSHLRSTESGRAQNTFSAIGDHPSVLGNRRRTESESGDVKDLHEDASKWVAPRRLL